MIVKDALRRQEEESRNLAMDGFPDPMGVGEVFQALQLYGVDEVYEFAPLPQGSYDDPLFTSMTLPPQPLLHSAGITILPRRSISLTFSKATMLTSIFHIKSNGRLVLKRRTLLSELLLHFAIPFAALSYFRGWKVALVASLVALLPDVNALLHAHRHSNLYVG